MTKGVYKKRADRFQPSERELTYAELRRSGLSSQQVARRLKLSKHRTGQFETYYNISRGLSARDSSVPQFSDHKTHVLDCLAAGGFPVCRRGVWLYPNLKGATA